MEKFNPHGTDFPDGKLHFTIKMEKGFVTLVSNKKGQPLSSQEEEVLQDEVLSDHTLMPKLKEEFIEEMNKMLALAAHGPM